MIPALFAGLSVAAIVGTVVVGSEWRTAAVMVAVAIGAAAVAAVAWRQERAIAEGDASRHWWKFLTAGVVVIATFVVVTSIIGDLGTETRWMAAMGLLASGVTLSATGVVLALVGASRRGASV